MSTLAADNPRVFETGQDNQLDELPIIANDIVYDGAAVGESSTTGTYRPLAGGDTFGGFAVAQCDNTGGSAAAKRIKVYRKGVVRLTVTGVSDRTSVDNAVYATDDDTFTLTASGATQIGKVKRWISGSIVLVYFEAVAVRSI